MLNVQLLQILQISFAIFSTSFKTDFTVQKHVAILKHQFKQKYFRYIKLTTLPTNIPLSVKNNILVNKNQ